MSLTRKVGEVEMNLANFRNDENGNQYGLKRCKYHCDYGDGEYCHYKEHDGCIYNKSQDEQIKGRRMPDAESMGMLFDDPPDISVDAFIKWCSESHMMGNATLKGIKYWVEKYKEQF